MRRGRRSSSPASHAIAVFTPIPTVRGGPCGDGDPLQEGGEGVRTPHRMLGRITPRIPRSGAGHVAVGTPGGKGVNESQPPGTDPKCLAVTPSTLVLCGLFGDKDARCQRGEVVPTPHPTLLAAKPEPPPLHC